MHALIEWVGTMAGPGEGPASGIKFQALLYSISNLATGLAFLAMAVAEMYLLYKRKDLSYKRLFWLFICLMIFFGISFLFDSLALWFATYPWLSYVKLTTALMAWGIFILFIRMMPAMLQMKSQNQLKGTIVEQHSELHSAHLKIIESERQFKLLVNHHPDCISQLDRNYRYGFVNKTILELTGLTEDFIVGKTIYELEHPKAFVDEQELHLKKAFEKGECTAFEAISILPQLGSRRFHISLIPVWNKATNTVESVLNIAKDITISGCLKMS